MAAYYNENDPDAVEWLRELIREGYIATGDVDDRSIKDVHAKDLVGYTQHHFFAGIGVWSYAARLAGWPDWSPIWTGSCPCQPFSASGKGGGFADPRDLWPDFFRLIRAFRPAVVMGELTSKKAGRIWFDRTSTDLDGEDYASRAVNIPSCAVDAPNERQRLYWCAMEHAAGKRRRQGRPQSAMVGRGHAFTGADASGHMGDADGARFSFRPGERSDSRAQRAAVERTNDSTGFWDEHEWIRCHDGKIRRAKPGTSLLVAGSAARIPMWRGLGNAINARLAEQVIRAFIDVYGYTKP
jgi:DNA (cytosine-5)-methyltransferase 1